VKYTGSANLTPVDGGYEGEGLGTYEGLDVLPPAGDCTESQRTTYAGPAKLLVYWQDSIDNSVTGGPDTSMYDANTTVMELLIRGDSISAESTGVPGGDPKCGTQSWSTPVGPDCHFFGIDFSVGGTFQKTDEDSPYAKCTVTVTPQR